ncbi:LOW QUALITY PROTEIN: hypothetical protein QTO34_015837 [Cnephaeus nilssonii]|uniref:Uncharacterized protein n=1 Tax=Cnephaeus nilssonii TaxID=3371016 RepID=A0AA40LRI8_CNENI|nr:LOW QUALITY PROTEIN: hypothetical protein QTO34_015837 [Eptesicus nilssonii]
MRQPQGATGEGLCGTDKDRYDSGKKTSKYGYSQETAKNIRFACQLLSKDMLSLEEEEIVLTLEAYWESKKNLPQRVSEQAAAVPAQGALGVIRYLNVDEQESWHEPRTDFLQARNVTVVAVLGDPAEEHVVGAIEQGLQHPQDSPEESQKYSPDSDDILPRSFRIQNPDTCYRIII